MTSETVYYVAQSVDGYIANRDGSLDWLLAFGFDDFHQQYDAFLEGVGAIVLGAATARWLAAQGEAWPYAGLPAWVVTRAGVPAFEGADLRAIDDPAAAITAARAAAAGRAVWVVGGGALAGSLADLGLLDRLHITVMPITLGGGTPVLPHRPVSIRWALESNAPIGASGAVELRYRAVRD